MLHESEGVSYYFEIFFLPLAGLSIRVWSPEDAGGGVIRTHRAGTAEAGEGGWDRGGGGGAGGGGGL